MTPVPAQTSGFLDPGRDSQATFRAAMDALARPGTIHALPTTLRAPALLSGGAAALALALCDYETPLWIDEALASNPEVGSYLRFHTGARITSAPSEAAFAIAADPLRLPDLAAFAIGTPDYPDRSTALILEVGSVAVSPGWSLAGPGVMAGMRFGVSGIRADLLAQRRALAMHFPKGIDILFAADAWVAALPRTTRVEA